MIDAWVFRDPLLLLLVIFTPIIYFISARLPSSITYSSLLLVKTDYRSMRVRLAKFPALLLAGAYLMLIIALAGPRTGDQSTEIKRDGIAIMLVFDRSGSMDARDFVKDDYSINRLQVVKEVLLNFVKGSDGQSGRPNDLLGLVTFGTFADGICPLTLDHENLLSILQQTEIATEQSEGATAIGEGLGLAVARLRASKAKSKVIILLTDGVNNAGNIEPLQAAELAAKENIKVYTIGAGTSGFAPMPVQTRDGRTVLQKARVQIDEETLKSIAKRSQGKYFHAKNAKALQDIYVEIDQLERSKITEIHYLNYREHYAGFVLLALLLISLSVLASTTVLRTLP